MNMDDSTDLEDFPFIDDDVDYRNLESIPEEEAESMTLHEFLTFLDGKQQ